MLQRPETPAPSARQVSWPWLAGLAAVSCGVTLLTVWRGSSRSGPLAAPGDRASGIVAPADSNLPAQTAATPSAGLAVAAAEASPQDVPNRSPSTADGKAQRAPRDTVKLVQPPPSSPSRPVAAHSLTTAPSPSAPPSANASPATATPSVRHAWAGIDLFFRIWPVADPTRDRLFQLLANYELEDRDIMEVSRQQGLPIPAITKLGIEFAGRLKQDVVALLGAEQGGQFISLRAASRFVPVAEEFAARCAAQGEPLSLRTLGAITVNFALNLQPPDAPALKVVLPSGEPIVDVVALRSAQKVLTPLQFDLLKKMWAERPYPKTPPGVVPPPTAPLK